MMPDSRYFVEFRGFAKHFLKDSHKDVVEKFSANNASKYVPHSTLIPTYTTNDEQAMLQEFTAFCEGYSLIKFHISSVDSFTFENKEIVFAKITPSRDLVHFRYLLHRRLSPLIECVSSNKSIDDFIFHATMLIECVSSNKSIDDFIFHATIWTGDSKEDAKEVKRYLSTDFPTIEQYMLRTTIVKDKLILAEYDFVQEKLLYRNDALSETIWKKTTDGLKKF